MRRLSLLLLLAYTTTVSADPAADLDRAVAAGIERNACSGAVVVVIHRDRIILRKAYGQRSKQPAAEAMTTDTIFDLASLTKPIATATSVMLLVEQGKLRLADPVAKHLPPFAQNGKDRITVEQLLIHTSGLIADNPIADYKDGREKALEHVYALKTINEPGSKFVYSDVNFIVLGELVAKLGGMPLDEFAAKHIFTPLGMSETGFRPAEKLHGRIAPTEKLGDGWLRGEVHDPRARALGWVAGHAGLFSTADDLVKFARMMLRGGEVEDGKRVLAPATVKTMTTARPVPNGLRALGWDVRTGYSANRGELFARDTGFGHTGFTGTSIWFDPESDAAVIFLSSRLHPDGKGDVTRLRGRVATIAASMVGRAPTAPRPVLNGIDVLVRDKFAQLKGRRVGLVTNHTGLDRDGRATIDLLHKAEGVTLVALFSPEHGIRGALDEKVGDSKDEKTGLPIYSLYGKRTKPDAETLNGVDTLVFDIQDIGCRFYTYSSTLGGLLEAGAANKVKVVVLDRANPIGGVGVEGPVLDAGRESFVAYHRIPLRHGMTLGELAKLFNAERKIGADLEVVKVEGWRRGDFYDRTGLTWVNPSPNMRSLTQALLYPGVGLLETTNVSVGRGTDRPFEWVGAPWLDGRKVAAAMTAEGLEGVRFVPVKMTPTGSVHKGKECGGVQLIVDDWSRFKPVRTGLALACVLRRVHPNDWQPEKYDRLLGHKATWEGVRAGKVWRELEDAWQDGLKEFMTLRSRYNLYTE